MLQTQTYTNKTQHALYTQAYTMPPALNSSLPHVHARTGALTGHALCVGPSLLTASTPASLLTYAAERAVFPWRRRRRR